MSKLLSEQEKRPNTTEKQAYAIVYAFKQFEYLIRDRKFVLRTDHQNLIYIDTENNAKVKRWKLMIQEYDFWIEHIAGIDNIIADAFSRLLVIRPVDLCLLEEFDVPVKIKNQIAEVHNEVTGHHGVERTLLKLKQKGETWIYMREHVRRFIRSCPCCQKMSYLKTPIHTHPFTVACYEPMERLAMDSIGPLPADEEGNIFIVTIICCFTRWTMLYAVKDLSAETFAKVLLRHIGIFGVPVQILSDNGTQFVNTLIESIIKLMGVQHLTVLAYSKEENSMVKRANKEVMRHLRVMIFTHNDHLQWDFRFLPMVTRILNTTKNESTGVSPADLLFGNAITLDRNIFLEPSELTDERIALSQWVANMLEKQKVFMENARERQRIKDKKHIANKDPRRTIFADGEYVLVEYHSTIVKKGPPNKFLSNLRGPFQIVSRDGDHYTIKNLYMDKQEVVHVSLIHPYIIDPNAMEPRNVAMRDVLTMFEVENILQHNGNSRKRSDMEFLVKFTGYDNSHNLWLPYNEVRNHPRLHEYLTYHRMRNLIPHDFLGDNPVRRR